MQLNSNKTRTGESVPASIITTLKRGGGRAEEGESK